MVKSLAIGHFDGLHLGHRELFKKLGENGGVLIIENDNPKLTPKREEFITLPIFYKHIDEVRKLSGEEFVLSLMSEFEELELIVVGYDFKFGYKKSSSADDLKRFFKGRVEVVDEVFYNDISVHTTKIRELLKNGEAKKASILLGRNYAIKGRVVSGQGIGKKELFATLNLEAKNYFLPKEGVYATLAYVKNKVYKSVTFVGHRVSTDSKFSIETHILEEFSEEASELTVEFIEFIRDNAKFDDLAKLRAQILDDIKKASEILNQIEKV
ncbi:MAG: bifunctional riboflavin kinase/FAD synthetase [Campylobacteraceae bacterium]|nr:bifunctional riboflavin kinase/FAD synthetase [Campylobacteraceae bacterium]